MSCKHITLHERELADLIKKLDDAVFCIGAVMVKWIWGPIKTGSYACACAQICFCWDHSEIIMVSIGPETVLFCFVLPHKIQYYFTAQSIYSNNNDVSCFVFRALSRLQCTSSYKSSIYHIVT